MRQAIETKQSLHLDALIRQKTDLEMLIGDELKRPRPCSLTIKRLKTMKLSVNDRIAAFRRHPMQSTVSPKAA